MFLKGKQYSEKSEPQGYFYRLYKAQQMPVANLMMNFSSDGFVRPKPFKIERCSDFLQKGSFYPLKWRAGAGHNKLFRINQSPEMAGEREGPVKKISLMMGENERIVWAALGFVLYMHMGSKSQRAFQKSGMVEKRDDCGTFVPSRLKHGN